ncbi:paraquat-inducible protein A [Verrucomicrobium spinosum]|uniref:paraquat-inducible protein A n=1 Tax=Verrucomicrobium spinosum TaxID=2736 RepID=UPI0001744EEA|nr:paraquat-inducible protein A [Verrucomicrobium spinosum]
MKRHHPWLSWPQLREGPMQLACHLCDTLQAAPRLREGDGAYCCVCGEKLYRNRPHSLAHATGFSSAALIFMVLAHLFPFLTMTSGSMTTRLTLMEAAHVLIRDGDPLVAAGIVFFTMVAPFVLVAGMLYVAAPLRHGVALPGAMRVTRWLQWMEPWSMLEVFLLGLIVSLLKLGKMAELDFGLGLWALGGLVLCTAAALGGIDKLELWDRLEVTQKGEANPA